MKRVISCCKSFKIIVGIAVLLSISGCKKENLCKFIIGCEKEKQCKDVVQGDFELVE